MILMTLFAAAAAAQLTALAVPTRGISAVNPCTNEWVDFEGPIDVEARTTLAGPNPTVELSARALAVTAEGRTGAASRYLTRDTLDLELETGPLPWATSTAWKARFTGGGRDLFDAHITLHVSVQPDGVVGVTLGNIVLSCP